MPAHRPYEVPLGCARWEVKHTVEAPDLEGITVSAPGWWTWATIAYTTKIISALDGLYRRINDALLRQA